MCSDFQVAILIHLRLYLFPFDPSLGFMTSAPPMHRSFRPLLFPTVFHPRPRNVEAGGLFRPSPRCVGLLSSSLALPFSPLSSWLRRKTSSVPPFRAFAALSAAAPNRSSLSLPLALFYPQFQLCASRRMSCDTASRSKVWW